MASTKLDPAFSGDGRAVFSDAPPADEAVLAPDGAVFASGFRTKTVKEGVYVSTRFSVTKVDPSGSLDRTFGRRGVAPLPVNGTFKKRRISGSRLQLTSDGHIVSIASVASATSNEARISVASLTPDGAIDTSFGGGDGYFLLDGSLSRMALDSQGRVLQVSPGLLMRFGRDGQLDPTFSGDGLTELPADLDGATVAATPDGGAVVASPRSGKFARFDANGSSALGFGVAGVAEVESAISDSLELDVGPAGDIYFVRELLIPGGSLTIGHLLPDGSRDPAFPGDSGLVSIIELNATDMDIDSAGRAVFARAFTGPRMAAARLTISGAPDESFGPDGRIAVRLRRYFAGARAIAAGPSQAVAVVGGATKKGKHKKARPNLAVAYLSSD